MHVAPFRIHLSSSMFVFYLKALNLPRILILNLTMRTSLTPRRFASHCTHSSTILKWPENLATIDGKCEESISLKVHNVHSPLAVISNRTRWFLWGNYFINARTLNYVIAICEDGRERSVTPLRSVTCNKRIIESVLGTIYCTLIIGTKWYTIIHSIYH